MKLFQACCILVLSLLLVGFSRAPKGEEETPEPTAPLEIIQPAPVDENTVPPAAQATPVLSGSADTARPAASEESALTEKATQPTETEESTSSGEAVETAAQGDIEDRGALEDTSMMPAHEYTDPSTPIEATIGEEFAISLDSNPTTGYGWRIAGKVDEKVVRLSGTQFVPSGSDLRGAPGRRVWTFKGAGQGTATLSFEYLRPWEKKPPIRKATFTLVVR
jgi:inhibitor of cysteine peptidase